MTDTALPFHSPPCLHVAVIMRREKITGPMSHWQPWRWVLDDVVPHEPGFGNQPRLLYQNESTQRWLHPHLEVKLYQDDIEGYHLNLSAPEPCWFVMWRLQEDAPQADLALALPQEVSLSYHDAGRWLDAQETVEQVPAPDTVLAWLQDFVSHHQLPPEPKRRQRPQSFQRLQDRFGNPASVTTEKKRGGGHGG